jgi:hypothetical protein
MRQKCFFRTSVSVSLAKRAYGIPALLAVETEAPMPEFSQFLCSDMLTCEDPRENKVKNGCPVIHPASGNTKNRNYFRLMIDD